MKPCKEYPERAKDKDGYIKVTRVYKGQTYTRLHRFLYAKHYKLNLTSKEVIRHLCNNPGCVEITHLAKGTNIDNMRDSLKVGTYHFINRTKITEEVKKEVRHLYKDTPLTQVQIAQKLGVANGVVSEVINKRYYKATGQIGKD